MENKKYKFVQEFEINASPKRIYGLLNNASELNRWFEEKVILEQGKIFNFIWDDTNHQAKIVSQKLNKYIKFEFLNDNSDEKPSYMEFRLEKSELTNATYLIVTDYSEMTDEQDLQELWESLVNNLREVL